MVDAWKVNIPKIWEERKHPLPAGTDPEELIRVPENAQYFAAIGAVEFGKEEEFHVGAYKGSAPLRTYLERGAAAQQKAKSSKRGLAKDDLELRAFLERYRREPFAPARFRRGETVAAFLGVDGGSTSTKAVLLSPDREVLAKSYGLSGGNPIEDTQCRIGELRRHVEEQGATLEIRGVGTTGYAKDILKDVLKADAAIVETVAHTESALHYYDDVDVVCDVGGQDIKIIALKNGKVKDFKLNTQCSAGNGYFLQSTAQNFGIEVEDYAETAFGTGAPSSCSPTSWTSSVRAGRPTRSWRASPPSCPRTSGSTSPRSPTWPSSGASSSCRAARSTTSRPSRRRSTSSRSASTTTQGSGPRSSSTSTRASREQSAPRWRRLGSTPAAGARSSSDSKTPGGFTTGPRATSPRDASSARTSACAPSST
jgi:hypothetical protein